MAWPKGKKKGYKTGGRQKGSCNKVLRSASEIFTKLAFNSIEEAISLIRDDSVEIQHRVGLLKEVIKYQYPQLRSVEHGNSNIGQVVLEDRRKMLLQIFHDPKSLDAAKLIVKQVQLNESD